MLEEISDAGVFDEAEMEEAYEDVRKTEKILSKRQEYFRECLDNLEFDLRNIVKIFQEEILDEVEPIYEDMNNILETYQKTLPSKLTEKDYALVEDARTLAEVCYEIREAAWTARDHAEDLKKKLFDFEYPRRKWNI